MNRYAAFEYGKNTGLFRNRFLSNTKKTKRKLYPFIAIKQTLQMTKAMIPAI